MNDPRADMRIRPGFLAIIGCVLAATIAIGWLVFARNHPPQPPPTTATQTQIETNHAVQLVAGRPRRVPPAAVAAAVPAPAAAMRSAALEQQWGIQVAGVHLAIESSALDVRYTVVAADKAAVLAQGTADAYLIDQASGTQIRMAPGSENTNLPLHSRARMVRQGGGFPPAPNRLAAGRTNSILFPNVRWLLKHGDKVTVVIGGVRVEDVVVN